MNCIEKIGNIAKIEAYSYDQMREDMRALTEIYGETIKLSIDVEDFSEDMYNRMTKDIVGEDLVFMRGVEL